MRKRLLIIQCREKYGRALHRVDTCFVKELRKLELSVQGDREHL